MAINGKVFNDSGEAQFLVWKSSVQDAFNQHAEAIANLTSIVQRLDIAVAFLVEKAGYTPADVQVFLDKKSQEYADTWKPPIFPHDIGELASVCLRVHLRERSFPDRNKVRKTSMSYTLIITSCDRHDLLRRTLDSFILYADEKPVETFIVEDAGVDPPLWYREAWPYYMSRLGKITWIKNPRRLGEFVSTDLVMSKVTTDWVFGLEDDWEFTDYGFIAKSRKIMEADPNIWTVSLRGNECNGHPVINGIHDPGWGGGWGGCHWNPGLRRISDWKRIGSYASHIDFLACTRQQELGLSRYHLELGYRIASPYSHPVITHTGADCHISEVINVLPLILVAIPTCHHLDYGKWDNTKIWPGGTNHTSGENNRVAILRESWLKDLPVDYKLFYGEPHPREPLSDEVFLACPDDYEHLPSKTVAICQWALANGYDYLLKVDDDACLDPSAIIPTLLQNRGDYMGHQQGNMNAGPFYWLSAKAMSFVSGITHPESIHWAEDRMVGRVLETHDIYPTNLPNYSLTPRAGAAAWCG